MDDPERCAKAGIREEHTIATKPALAAEMIDRVLDAGVQATWVTGDSVYGQHSGLGRRLESRGIHYVMGMPMNQQVITPASGGFGAQGRVDECQAPGLIEATFLVFLLGFRDRAILFVNC